MQRAHDASADDYHIVAQLDPGVADAVNAAGERLGQRRVIQIHIVGELIHRLGADGHILGKAARSHNAGMRMRHEGRHAQVFVTAAAVVALAAGVQQPDSRFVAGLYAFHVRADGLYDPGRLVASGIRIPGDDALPDALLERAYGAARYLQQHLAAGRLSLLQNPRFHFADAGMNAYFICFHFRLSPFSVKPVHFLQRRVHAAILVHQAHRGSPAEAPVRGPFLRRRE